MLMHADNYIAQQTCHAYDGVKREARVHKSEWLWKKPWLEADNDFCRFPTTGLNDYTSAWKIPGEEISDTVEAYTYEVYIIILLS
jgi:hypothetical protein